MGPASQCGSWEHLPFIWSAAGGPAGFRTGRGHDSILIFRSMRLLFLLAKRMGARGRRVDWGWRLPQSFRKARMREFHSFEKHVLAMDRSVGVRGTSVNTVSSVSSFY